MDIMDENKITKDIVILYHAECNDGFGAAWAAWKKFGDEADYIPVYYHKSPPQGLENKEVYTLDFTYSKEIMEKLLKETKRLTSVDHHITQKEAIKLTYQYSYSTKNSGSVLTWKYFHSDKPVPKLLLFIEDIDIWKWEYPETERILSALSLYNLDFIVWDKIASDLENDEKLKDYLSKGEVIVVFRKKVIDDLASHAQKVEFEGYKVYSANTPSWFRDGVAAILREKHPPFSVIWRQDSDTIHVSLRSLGDFDVSEIAQKYGGGGHKNAAGFSFPAGQPFPWKIIKE